MKKLGWCLVLACAGLVFLIARDLEPRDGLEAWRAMRDARHPELFL